MFEWVSSDREKEHGNAAYQEGAAIQNRVTTEFHHYSVGIELPLGMRQLTTGHCAIMHDVMIGTRLFHLFAAEGKWIGRRQYEATYPRPHSDGADHVVKAASLGAHVVGSVGCLNVLVVGTSI